MSVEREFASAGVIAGDLYALGGSNAGGLLNVTERYDPASDTWTREASMPTARFALGVGAFNGSLFAVGGATVGTVTNANEEYTP
jgi:hypothetical protein